MIFLENFFDNIKDFFFPKICIISDKKLSRENSNDFVDDKLLSGIPRLTPDDLLELREKVKADFFNSYLPFRSESPAQVLIHYLKYRGFSRIGSFLGKYYGGEYVKTFTKLERYDIICPVPLFKTKVRERGYNQSEFICSGLNSILGISQINNLIIRTRHTKSQTHLKYFERLSNVKDAFKINDTFKCKISGKSILLVDDVVTTGATMNEVIKVLRNEDIKEISAFTIASAR
ncbi:MAG: ComF family protein [Ignavibacteriae bacterium]|nr:ComF family protein [Ignavibacteriota bacterium]